MLLYDSEKTDAGDLYQSSAKFFICPTSDVGPGFPMRHTRLGNAFNRKPISARKLACPLDRVHLKPADVRHLL